MFLLLWRPSISIFQRVSGSFSQHETESGEISGIDFTLHIFCLIALKMQRGTKRLITSNGTRPSFTCEPLKPDYLLFWTGNAPIFEVSLPLCLRSSLCVCVCVSGPEVSSPPRSPLSSPRCLKALSKSWRCHQRGETPKGSTFASPLFNLAGWFGTPR